MHVQQREDGNGNLQHFEGEVVYAPEAGREPTRVERMEHDIEFIPGSRHWSRLTYDLYLWTLT